MCKAMPHTAHIIEYLCLKISWDLPFITNKIRIKKLTDYARPYIYTRIECELYLFLCAMLISCIIWTYRVFLLYFKKWKHIPPREISPQIPQKISKYFAQWIKELVHSQKARPNIIISSFRNNLKKKSAFGKPF